MMTETPRQIAERISREYRQAPNLADLIENAILKFADTEKLAAAYKHRAVKHIIGVGEG
jgi:hypothetical protein